MSFKSPFRISSRAISTNAQKTCEDSFISSSNIESKIANIKFTNFSKKKWFNLTKDFLCDPNFLKYAYSQLSKNKGADQKTLDGIDDN
jgi:hypothetical protein